MSVVISTSVVELANNASLQRRLSGWHLSKVDNTKIEPPMLVEAVGTIEKPEDDLHVVDLTVWPANGWMVGLQMTVDNGLTGTNSLEFTYNPS